VCLLSKVSSMLHALRSTLASLESMLTTSSLRRGEDSISQIDCITIRVACILT